MNIHQIAAVVKKELKEAIAPTIYFWATFHLLMLTKSLILKSYEIEWAAVATALIAALIVAKAILIVNALGVSRQFMDKPLIVPVLWRTLLYSSLVFVFRYLEEVIPLWSKFGSFSAGNAHLLDGMSWPQFWAIQLWLFIATVVYSMFVTLDEHFGEGSMRAALFKGRAARA
ncbi:MAG TPA: hypothetical protein PKK10_13670 [Woeseiaceae bacterium]|nr:hypothetical protein [Woeseiaceae bacterium]